MTDAVTSDDAFVEVDATFHTLILQMSSNECFDGLAPAVFAALLGSVRTTIGDPRANLASVPFHRHVDDAISRRKHARARAAMTELLSDALDRVGMFPASARGARS